MSILLEASCLITLVVRQTYDAEATIYLFTLMTQKYLWSSSGGWVAAEVGVFGSYKIIH